MSRPGGPGRGVGLQRMVTENQAEEVAVSFFWYGCMVGFGTCALISVLAGWW